MALDLEDSRLVHLTRVPVSHINVVRLNQLHVKGLTVLDHFVGEKTRMWVREVVVFVNIDAGLHSADSRFIMKSVKLLPSKNFFRKNEEIKAICDSERCPDPSALALRSCCEKFLRLVILLVVHLSFVILLLTKFCNCSSFKRQL